MKAIGVFFGGTTVEHDVSIITGVLTVNTLKRENYNVVPIYVDKKGEWYSGEELCDPDGYKNLNYKKLKRVTLLGGSNVLYYLKGSKLKKGESLSSVVNCMHGERGEDGSLAGLLSMCNIAFASPPQLASSISIDKRFTKTVMKGLKVKTLPFVYLEDEEQLLLNLKKIKFPVIVKPNLLGSSIGVSRVEDKKALVDAFRYALRFGKGVIIEPCLENFIEINCAAYKSSDNKVIVSECERPIGRTNVLTFGDKYEEGKREFPANIDNKISDKIKQITKKIYCELGFIGVIRIDYFVLGEEIFLNEINSVPGSLAYYLFGDTLKSFGEMLKEMIDLSEKEFAKKSTMVTQYNSGILNGVGSKGAKRL